MAKAPAWGRAREGQTPMTTSWEKMTTEEKVEGIRSDLKNTMTSLNMLIQHQSRLGEQLRALQGELRAVTKQKNPQPHRVPETSPA